VNYLIYAQAQERVKRLLPPVAPLALIGTGTTFALDDALVDLLPSIVPERIYDFALRLAGAGLLHLPEQFTVHYPLIDWHWPVFGQPGKLQTAVEGLYAIGDLSGHARGLLQAATMGWLAAEEIIKS
jgi:hypothetical protein